jgi:trimethylamine--corrinoid protein Co-methyltransferase
MQEYHQIAGERRTMIKGMFNPLTEEEIVLIHSHALKVLEETGIEAKDTSALDLLTQNGASVNGTIVKIPRSMVADALESTPSEVVLCGRNKRQSLVLKNREAHLGTGGAALKVIDIDEREPRNATLNDIGQIARLVDTLDHIEFYLRPVVAHDVSREDLDVNKYFAGMRYTSKHVMGSVYSMESLAQVKTLGAIIAGSSDSLRKTPFLSFITCWMKCPLTLDPKPTQLMMEIVRDGLPVVLSSAPMTGSTAPVTLSGCLVQLHAEILSGAVLTQLINPGTPVIYGYVPSIANPYTMGYLGGAAEFGLMNAAAVQLASYYGLPNYSSAGLTDSKLLDAQAGVEKALSILQVAMAGGNFIHHAAGMLESMLTVSYAQYVIDNDILGMVARIIRGIEVTPDTIAFDTIGTVGPGGNYIAQKHTAKHLRSEYFFPQIMNRDVRKEWENQGSPDLWMKANEKAREILSTEPSPQIPSDIESEIRQRLTILKV